MNAHKEPSIAYRVVRGRWKFIRIILPMGDIRIAVRRRRPANRHRCQLRHHLLLTMPIRRIGSTEQLPRPGRRLLFIRVSILLVRQSLSGVRRISRPTVIRAVLLGIRIVPFHTRSDAGAVPLIHVVLGHGTIMI